MLTKPQYGWSDFSLNGTSVYGLSYLTDVAFEWVGQTIHGLETLHPFCVKGSLEPDRMLCMVSYWSCYITVESETEKPYTEERMVQEYSHTSMIDFCRSLYADISGSMDEWVSFVDYLEEDLEEKRGRLAEKLERLKELISEQEKYFGPNYWLN